MGVAVGGKVVGCDVGTAVELSSAVLLEVANVGMVVGACPRAACMDTSSNKHVFHRLEKVVVCQWLLFVVLASPFSLNLRIVQVTTRVLCRAFQAFDPLSLFPSFASGVVLICKNDKD